MLSINAPLTIAYGALPGRNSNYQISRRIAKGRQITELFGKAKGTISEHIKHIFEDGELAEEAVVRLFRTTGPDSKQPVLDGAGAVSHDEALDWAEGQYTAFAERRRVEAEAKGA